MSLTLNPITGQFDVVVKDHTKLKNIGANTHSQIDTHIANTSNPHSVTANQVLPSQTGNNGKYLTTDGSNSSWGSPAGAGDVVGDDTTVTDQNIVAYNGTGGKNIEELTGTQGDILYHDGTSWAKLGAGTSGYLLKTQGAGANPAWDATGVAQSWTPTFTNLTVGNGTLDCSYSVMGKTVYAQVHLTLGSTSSISGTVSFTIPTGSISGSLLQPLGIAILGDTGVAQYSGAAYYQSSTAVLVRYFTVNASSKVIQSAISSTAPFTWAEGDRFTCNFTYLLA